MEEIGDLLVRISAEACGRGCVLSGFPKFFKVREKSGHFSLSQEMLKKFGKIED